MDYVKDWDLNEEGNVTFCGVTMGSLDTLKDSLMEEVSQFDMTGKLRKAITLVVDYVACPTCGSNAFQAHHTHDGLTFGYCRQCGVALYKLNGVVHRQRDGKSGYTRVVKTTSMYMGPSRNEEDEWSVKKIWKG